MNKCSICNEEIKQNFPPIKITIETEKDILNVYKTVCKECEDYLEEHIDWLKKEHISR